MAISDRQLLHSLSRIPLVDSVESALLLGEPHATIHRALPNLLADGIFGRVSRGTAHLPSSRRHYRASRGVREATHMLDFDTSSEFVRAYPTSKEWLTLLTHWMGGCLLDIGWVNAMRVPPSRLDGAEGGVEQH